MAVTAQLVKELREMTGAGMMDCKKALVETDGNIEAAVDFLREKGLAKAAKKAGRIAAEGQVVALVEGKAGIILEVNAETDFVAGGDPFKEMCQKIAKVTLEQKPADVDALLKCTYEGMTVEEIVQELFLKLRENMKIRRFERVEGNVVSYIHGGGRIGVLVNFDTTEEAAATAEFNEMAKDVAMQIAAINPAYLDQASVPAEVIEKEKEIMIAQMKEDPKMANKPEQVLEKIVTGKIGKYYKENCLLEQAFVKDGDMTVAKYIDSVAKKLGADIKMVSYIRYEKGEGIQKREDDFAAEVASMVK